jgi:SHS2 domain-containing protein
MWRLLAHTADLRAEVAAASFEALCGQAIDLVRETLVGSSPVGSVERRLVRFEGDDEAERFFRFVRELVYLADAERFLPASGTPADGGFEVSGERFDPARHVAERQVKALTRHRYGYARDAGGGVRAELVFDL